MKYYSEELNKMFDTEDELLEAEYRSKCEKESREAAEKEKQAERQRRYDELLAASALLEEAYNEYQKLKNAYLRDYGTLHIPCTSRSWDRNTIWRLFQ